MALPEVRGLSHPAKLEKMQRLPRSTVEVVQRHSGSEKCCHAQPARQCGDLLHCHCGSWAVPLVGDGIPSDTGVEEQCSGNESPVGDLVFFNNKYMSVYVYPWTWDDVGWWVVMIPINFPNIDMSHTHTHWYIYIYKYPSPSFYRWLQTIQNYHHINIY